MEQAGAPLLTDCIVPVRFFRIYLFGIVFFVFLFTFFLRIAIMSMPFFAIDPQGKNSYVVR